MTPEDVDRRIRALLARYGPVKTDAGIDAAALQKVLNDLAAPAGFPDSFAVERVAALSGVPRGRVEHLLKEQFPAADGASPSPTPINIYVFVCEGTSCFRARCGRIRRAAEESLGLRLGQIAPDKSVRLVSANCLGRCERSPCLEIDGVIHDSLTPERVRALLQELKPRS